MSGAAEVIRCDSLDQALVQAGMPAPRSVELRADAFSRWDDPEGSRGNAACWVLPFADGRGAVFGSWRTGEVLTWQKVHDGPPPSRQEREQFQRQVDQARREAQAAREADHAAAAQKAQARWNAAKPATAHPYLERKAVQPHGCRIEGDCLLVPVLDAQGELQSLQSIAADGSKRFLSGGRMAGGRYWLGSPGARVVLAEGLATGAAIHEATGLPVCCAFSAGNLKPVAESIRQAHPDATIIIAGDDDRHEDGKPNTGRIKALEAAQAVSGACLLPDLGRKADWQDFRAERGDAALRQAFNPPPRFRLLGRDDLRNLPDLEWRIDGVLPMTGIGLVIGQSGHGKSFVALDLLARVALGLPWFGHPTRATRTVYVGLEGRAGIKRRVEAWERRHGQQMPAGFAVVLDPLRLTEPDDIHDLARAVLAADGEGGLIVVDTLAQASPGIDENSSQDMGLVIEGLQRLQSLTGGLVLAVHHMGKDSARGARGHSSLYAACDAVISTTKAGDLVTVSTHGEAGGKTKDGEPVEHAAMLERVVLRTLADGHEIAGACLVEGEAAPVRLPKKPRGKHMTIVWDHVGAMLREVGDTRPAGAPGALPEGRPALRLEDAREKVCPLLPVEAKHRNQRFNEAITGLVAGGWMDHADGWLWVK